MHNGPRAQYDRELMAQGVGNIVCGGLGALPMTGVIVRSSANVLAGGKTRLSTVMHGCWLLLFVVGLPQMMSYIPRSCLGAILVYTGIKLVNVKAIKELWSYGKSEVAIYAVTLAVIVAADLLTGVLVGIALAAAKLLYGVSHLHTDLQITHGGKQAVLKLRGSATFLRLPKLADELQRVPQGTSLHVDFEHLDYIDHACIDLLMSWAKQHESVGGRLTIDWDSLHARFRSESSNGKPKLTDRLPRRKKLPAPREDAVPSSEG
jgi:MFS superfamily sulfate permease-like transporter